MHGKKRYQCPVNYFTTSDTETIPIETRQPALFYLIWIGTSYSTTWNMKFLTMTSNSRGFCTIFCCRLQVRVDALRIVYVGELRLPNDIWMEKISEIFIAVCRWSLYRIFFGGSTIRHNVLRHSVGESMLPPGFIRSGEAVRFLIFWIQYLRVWNYFFE